MKSDKPESLLTLRPVNSFRYNQYSTCLRISLLCHCSVGKESACNAGHPSSIPGSGRSTVEGIGYHSRILGLPLWLSWQTICLQCRKPGFSPWVGKIPWRRERLPTPIFWPGEFHGLYRPWGHKELDTFTFPQIGLQYIFFLGVFH